MTIAPVSNSSPLSYSSINNDRQNFQDLVNSIQSGDLSAAQQAFASLQDVSSSLSASSPLGQDFAAIGSAINSGNVSDAQQALQTLQTDAQQIGRGQGHGHHHHHHAKAAGAATDPANALDPTLPPNATFTITT